jgi:hypothetical protein
MHMSRSPKEAKASPNKAGRPRGRVPRPPIQIDGDVLIPKTEAAQQLGVAVRTLTRMRPPTVMFGGIAYVAREKLRQMIADGLSSPKRGRRR